MSAAPVPTPSPSFEVPASLSSEVDEIIARYPQRRSASLMVLHALQDHFGYLSPQAVEWAVEKLGLEPINLYELVTFYPMFRQEPVGKYHLKICRTLSCALGGAYELRAYLCQKLGLDSTRHGMQTTADGKFTVEFVECLASCGTPPVIMCNDEFHENVTPPKADEILDQCR